MEPDSGTSNIRNLSSAHWKRCLGPEHRCLAPFAGLAHKPKYLMQLHLSDRAANSALALVFSVGTA
jgi:hypothetical protein